MAAAVAAAVAAAAAAAVAVAATTRAVVVVVVVAIPGDAETAEVVEQHGAGIGLSVSSDGRIVVRVTIGSRGFFCKTRSEKKATHRHCTTPCSCISYATKQRSQYPCACQLRLRPIACMSHYLQPLIPFLQCIHSHNQPLGLVCVEKHLLLQLGHQRLTRP